MALSEDVEIKEYKPMFTFGTLRRGEGNSPLMSGYKYCVDATLKGYRKEGLRIFEDTNGSVKGTLYFWGFEDETGEENPMYGISGRWNSFTDNYYTSLRRIDSLEGIEDGSRSGWYNRISVMVEDENGEVWNCWCYATP